MNIEKSLAALGDRINKAREDLRIVEEQILFQMDVVEEAKTRMLVSETPLADREFRVARDDYERLQSQRAEVAGRIAELQSEQDRLLDRMLGTAESSDAEAPTGAGPQG
jgi:chromosome segregation ATPase